MKSPEERSVDPATIEMLSHIADKDISTAWDRHDNQQPHCGFGQTGLCCRICTMGPCRMSPFGDGPREGVCGATPDIIVARNLARMMAAGSAAHSDHGRDVAHTLKMAAEDENSDFKIKGEGRVKDLAVEFGIETDGRDIREIAGDVADVALKQFAQQEGEIVYTHRAPEDQQRRWREAGVLPRGTDREVVEVMHRTNIGVDNNAETILLSGIRAALADGWGGSMVATDFSDVLFRPPHWIVSQANLGVLKSGSVNVVVHGHEPSLSEMIVAAAQDKSLIEAAKSKGADGISIAGLCCTANEVLMRHGIPVAGNSLQQELAIATGVVDVMVIDVQCIFPSVGDIAGKFHTKVLSTSSKAQFPNTEHLQFDETRGMEIAKQIVQAAIDNYPNRDESLVHVPEHTSPLVAGFTAENVYTALGGRYRSSYRPLNDSIMAGRIRGVAGVIGCNNPKLQHDRCHIDMTKELLANDVLVGVTGCSAVASAKFGLLCPESAFEYAGKGLQEVCRAVGIPPVLHFGACVDNSRILMVLANMAKEGGLGDSIADLPVAGAAPEWMSEKAVAIGFYVAASGVYTVLGEPLPVEGSEIVNDFVCGGMADHFGGKFAFEADPIKAARLMMDHIDSKRAALKLPGPMYQVPYAPKTLKETKAAG